MKTRLKEALEALLEENVFEKPALEAAQPAAATQPVTPPSAPDADRQAEL